MYSLDLMKMENAESYTHNNLRIVLLKLVLTK